jgi:hypothetical protein
MPSFTYKSIWQEAQKVRWQVADLIGPDKPLDFSRPFLPESIARVADIPGLTPQEMRANTSTCSRVLPRPLNRGLELSATVLARPR